MAVPLPAPAGSEPLTVAQAAESCKPWRVLLRSVGAAFLRHAGVLHALAVVAFLLLFAGAATLLAVEPDEAWILFSTMKAFGIPVPATGAVLNPTVTSGGLHLVLHGALALLTPSIVVHRFVSLLFSALLLILVFRALRSLAASVTLALAGTALFAAAPGFVLQASLGTAEVVATALLLAGLLLWAGRGGRSVPAAIATGALLGLACATRVNCVVALPALLLCAFLTGPSWRERLILPGLCAAVACLVFAAGLVGYIVAAHVGDFESFRTQVTQATGVAGTRGWTSIARYLRISGGFVPGFVIIGIVAAAVAGVLGRAPARSHTLFHLLLVTALAGWAVWAWKAPIAHVRYLWPFIACFWLAGIMLVLELVQRATRPHVPLAFHAAVLAVCAYQGLATAALVANGESLILVYQLNQGTATVLPRHELRAADEQRAAARFIAGLPPTAKLYALNPPVDYPLTYLSSRPIDALKDVRNFEGEQTYIVMVPADFAIWRPSPAFAVWLAQCGKLAFRSGETAIYAIPASAPVPDTRLFAIGQNDIFPESR